MLKPGHHTHHSAEFTERRGAYNILYNHNCLSTSAVYIIYPLLEANKREAVVRRYWDFPQGHGKVTQGHIKVKLGKVGKISTFFSLKTF